MSFEFSSMGMASLNKFTSIGTSKVSIGYGMKMGSCSMQELNKSKLYPNITMEHKWIQDPLSKVYVILIKDIIDKWKSGYLEELLQFSPRHLDQPALSHEDGDLNSTESKLFWDRIIGQGKYSGFPPFYKTFTNPDKATSIGLNQLYLYHSLPTSDYESYNQIWSDISASLGFGPKTWMFSGHATFWQWNNSNPDTGLFYYMTHRNMYFLELKDLSNPKFLEWLQEKDERWKEVKEIPHFHKTNKNYEIQIDLFWKEYKEGKILQDRRYRSGQKRLICPFYDLPGNKLVPEFKTLHLMVKQQQEVVDFIRKNHERYIRL